MSELADGIERVEDPEVLPIGLPIHFVRGLNNRYDPAVATALDARRLDFMRGEGTQLRGMLRGLFITRFLDTLLETSAAQRRLYLETVVASEDLKVISEFDHLGFPFPSEIVLIGNSMRIELYEYLLATELEPDLRITTVTDDGAVDRLSIQGTLALLRRAGVLG